MWPHNDSAIIKCHAAGNCTDITVSCTANADGPKVQLTGTLTAVDSIDGRCSDVLMQGFRSSVGEVIDQVTTSIRRGHVTACPSNLKVTTGDMQFVVHGKQVKK